MYLKENEIIVKISVYFNINMEHCQLLCSAPESKQNLECVRQGLSERLCDTRHVAYA